MNCGVTSVEIVSPTSRPIESTNSSLIFHQPHFLLILRRKGTLLFAYCLGRNQKPSKRRAPSLNSSSVKFLKSGITILLNNFIENYGSPTSFTSFVDVYTIFRLFTVLISRSNSTSIQSLWKISRFVHIRVPSRVVAVIFSRLATAISFFTSSSTSPPQTTST